LLPKAAWYLRHRAARAPADPKQLADLQHLVPIMDWPYLTELLTAGGVRWGRWRLPRWLSPFPATLLALREDLVLRGA
jgi:hypothetical protein